MQLPQLIVGVLLATLTTPHLALALPSSIKSPTLWPRAALSLNPLSKRETCVETCSSTCYWQSDIDAALNKGFSLLQSGQTLGSGAYPHQYNDFEGFDFPVSGPWYEFPILSSFQVYTGGSPGPDRVIFNQDGEYADVITHTGASGNDFVACTP